MARPQRREASRPSVSPQYDLKGKRLQPANNPGLPRTRTLAGATVLQIVPAMTDEPAAHAAINNAQMLISCRARAIIAADNGPLAGELRALGGEWLPMSNEGFNPLRVRENAKRLRALIKSDRIDIVHAQSAGAAWSAIMATDRLPTWLVTSFPDRLTGHTWLGTLARSSLARGDHVIAPSSFVSLAMIERYKINPERISVIPRSVETSLFNPAMMTVERIAQQRRAWGILPNMRVVLVAGRLVPWNGQMCVLDAARLLIGGGNRGIVFVFAGDDRADSRYTQVLAMRARRHGIETLMRFVGHCRDMPTALAAADVVVVPAIEPPLTGRAVAEAQAMGRPVVTQAIGPLPENLLAPPRMPEHLRTGWVVRPNHAGALADGINAALSLNRPAYDALGGRARQFAEFMFSPQKIAEGVRGVYSALLARTD